MFIAMSFSYGLAVYLLVLVAAYAWSGRTLADAVLARLAKLLAVFIAAVLYFVAVFHLTNLYFAKQVGFERFILVDGGVYPLLFWLGQLLLGSIVPLALLARPLAGAVRSTVTLAATLVVLGGLAQMYVTIIGGQAYPLELFPGMEEASSFFDGRIHPYAPSVPEALLGIGGAAMAAIIVVAALKLLRFLPERLDDRLAEAG
jgi:molybdopterin-containing oxidoreductase family membrane subunit